MIQTKVTGPSHYPSTATTPTPAVGPVEVYRLVDLMSDFHARNTKKVDLLSSLSSSSSAVAAGAGSGNGGNQFLRGQDHHQVTHRSGTGDNRLTD